MTTLSKLEIQPEPDFIPLSVPVIQGNEWLYVKECLDTGWISSVGPYVTRFENDLANYVGTKYAVAVVNGTAGLHVSLLAAGVQPDDEVLVSTLTFLAPVNAIHYVGARPVLMDADPVTWQMDPLKVVDFLENECAWSHDELHNKVTGRRIKAIIPVHILGHPVDLDPICAVAKKYHLTIIEDATESLGARYRDQMVGQFGKTACFSFNGNKIISTGGGGMIVTNDQSLAEHMRYLTTQAKDDPVEYVHEEIGYNYRLTNVLAALGAAQLECLPAYIASKHRAAAHYRQHLGGLPGITLPAEAPWANSTFWLYTILIDPGRCHIDSRGLMRQLHDQRIQTRPLWRPAHRQAPYKTTQAYRIEVADHLYATALSLPCSTNITDEQLNRVTETICNLVR